MSLGMTIPMVVSAWSTLKSLISSETVVKIANTAATYAQVAAEKALKETKDEGSKSTKKNIKETIKDTAQKKKDTWNDSVWDKLGKEDQDKYLEDALKKKGYSRDSKGRGWGKTAPSKGGKGPNRFSKTSIISNDEAIK
jgi:hypothetical protein